MPTSFMSGGISLVCWSAFHLASHLPPLIESTKRLFKCIILCLFKRQKNSTFPCLKCGSKSISNTLIFHGFIQGYCSQNQNIPIRNCIKNRTLTCPILRSHLASRQYFCLGKPMISNPTLSRPISTLWKLQYSSIILQTTILCKS